MHWLFSGSALAAVETLSVGREDCRFVSFIDVIAVKQFIDLVAAVFGVETLVGKIGGEQKSFVARFFDGKAQAAVVAVEADEDAPTFTWRRKYSLARTLGCELARNSPLISTCK